MNSRTILFVLLALVAERYAGRKAVCKTARQEDCQIPLT
jgi:hypothetical protein